MTRNVEGFIPYLVEDVCASLRLIDPGTQQLSTDDLAVRTGAKLALAQVETYLRRNLPKQTYAELYPDPSGAILLRHWPYIEVTNVQWARTTSYDGLNDIELGDALVLDTDYTLRSNRRVVLSKDAEPSGFADESTLQTMFSSATDSSYHSLLLIEYEGGFTNTAEQDQIHAALLQQTIAVYNRLPTSGLAAVSGGDIAGGSIRMSNYNVDAGALLDGVAIMLERFVYAGDAREY